MEFTPFTARDFDAYLENKWESHVFNRERLEVKEKLQALGRLVAPQMISGDGSLLDCEVSVEHPALWNQRRVQNQCLFFSRNATARRELDTLISQKRSMAAMIEDPSPLRNHIFLAVMIDSQQVELSMKLHSDAAVDRENLQRKCQEYFLRERLLLALRGLPEAYSVGIQGQSLQLARALDDEGLQRLVHELPTANSWLVVSRRISRDDPLAQQPAFVEFAREELSRLLPVLNLIAWTRENDLSLVKDTLKKQEVRKRSKGIAKHDQVRVVRGIFSGKTGVVQETDAKGGLRVLLGSMVVKLSGEDVVKV